MKKLMGQKLDNIHGLFDRRKLSIGNRKDLSDILEISEFEDFFVEGGVGVFRHGKTVENIDGEDKPKSILVELDRTEFTDNGNILSSIKKLQELGFNKENIHIYTANDTRRINQTLQIICKELGIEFNQKKLGKIENNKYITIDDRFSARKKGESSDNLTIPLNIAGKSDIYGQESLLQAMNRAASAIYDLQLKQRKNSRIKLLLIVGYRTTIGGFEHKLEGKRLEDKTIKADFAQIKIQGLTSKKDVLRIKNLYAFKFDINNFLEELSLWNNKIFGKDYKKANFTLFDWQNWINFNILNLSIKNRKILFTFIISNNNFTSNIIAFSLINLIKLGKKDIILSNIKNLSGSSEIKESLSQLIHTEQDENIKNLAKEILYEINIYEFLEQHYQKNINPIIQEVRSRSLDVRLRNGEDIHPTFRFENKKYNDDIINIVSGNQGIKVIQANAGSGKSFFMSYLNQLLYKKIYQYDKKLYPIYINLSGKNLFQIKEKIIELQKDKLNGLSEIYLLDSLDEALLSEVDKDNFFQYLTKIGSLFIITSRPGHIPKDYQEKVETIILKEFRKKDIDNFVLSYFGEDKDKLQNFQKFTQNNWVEDICNNPLMLSMICEIINGRDYDFVRNIEDIKNISDLYDTIITLRLYIWNKGIKDREIRGYKSNLEIDTKRKEKNIERRKKLLAKLAYDSYLMDKAIDENYILDLEEAENIYDIESLNLIYRKGDNGRFAFVHESFREYFASSYFFDKITIPQSKEELILDLVKLFDIEIVGHNDVKLQLAKDIVSFFEKPPQKNSPRLPLATFCFDGPSGVGKSTFIKIINKIFFLFRYYSGIENLNILELSNLNLNIDSFSVFEGEEYFEYYSMRRYFDNYNNGRRTFIDKNEDLSSTILVIESRDCFAYNGNDIVCESKESQLGFKKLMGEDYIGKIDYLYKLSNLSRKFGKEILTREILKYNKQIMEFMAINKQVALSVVVLDDVLDYVIEQGFDEDYGARSLLGTFDKLIIDKIELSMENGELYSKIKKGYKYRLYVYIKNEKIKLSLMEIGKIKIPKKSKEEQTSNGVLPSKTNFHPLELYGSQYTEVPILESAQDGMKNTDFSWIHQKPSIGNRKILEDFEKKLAEKQKDSLFTRFMEGKGGNNIIDITSLFDGKIPSFPENIDSLHSIIIEVQKLEIEYVKTYCISYEEGIDYSDRLNEIISRLVSLGITEKDLKDLMKSAMIASIDYLGFIDSYRNIILTIDERENTNLFSPIHNNSIKKMVNHFIFEAMDMGLKAEDAEMKEIISAIVYRVENLVNKSLNAKQLKALRELIAKAFTEYKK